MTRFPESLLPLTLTDPMIRAFWAAAFKQGRDFDLPMAIEMIVALQSRADSLEKRLVKLFSVMPLPPLVLPPA